ncbi:hypothetical protein [Flavobacterium covae]|uniref:hypothetical protein n=1 Tax=Flavobacterium covae TaxID=2906076 RepID=UPI000745D392|nr:hypothetical protein [Flavobacterium covae]AMA49974.1 hypothetical protein AWN65_11155 [Flavobacterium covae]MCJ1808594.1 hypothetical protein [Flavobacterium covae]
MKKQFKKVICILFIATFLISCKKTDSSSRFYEYEDNETSYNEEEFPDGEYCAEIDYHNPDTGTSSTYTLTVEVESGELVKIEWNNGGWLDSSHYSPPDISDGTASFEDDRGREFEVRILSDGSCSNSSYVGDNGNENYYGSEEDESNSYFEEEEEGSEE